MKIELPAGTIVASKYRIETLLGSGAVGTVYAAEHVATGKRVALKCVDVSHATDPAAAERLAREAQAAARVRHPNVVDIYDVGRDGKLLFLVMECLEGEPLSFQIARRDLPPHKLIALLLPAMRGVAEAHRQGVIHRDIKPENIFLARQTDARQPLAKVLDFGISKLDARGRSLRALTADGYAIGTPGYMAYEQALGDKTVDGRADVYAFGAILYEALTGRVPHDGEDFPSLVQHFLKQRVATPIELGLPIPASLSALVMWAIERDRETRLSSMESLIRELEPFALERSYESASDQADASRQPRGKTLVGPWGVGMRLLGPSMASRALGNTPTSLAPTTVEARLWLQRTRTRHKHKAALYGALVVLLIALLGFSLAPSAPTRSEVKQQIASPSGIPTRTNAPAASAPPAAELTAESPPQSRPAAAEVQRAQSTTAPATATPVPPRPAPNRAPSAPKPVAKARDFGIY